MNTNYSNNYHQSFGSFNFSKDAKELLQLRIKTSAKLAKFEKICNNEDTGARASRNINVKTVPNYPEGPIMVASYKDTILYEKYFDTPSFLEKATKLADAIDNPITKVIDRLA